MPNPQAINPADITFSQYMNSYISPQSNTSSLSPIQAVKTQQNNKLDQTFTSKISDIEELSNRKNRKDESNVDALSVKNSNSKLSISNMLPELIGNYLFI